MIGKNEQNIKLHYSINLSNKFYYFLKIKLYPLSDVEMFEVGRLLIIELFGLFSGVDAEDSRKAS